MNMDMQRDSEKDRDRRESGPALCWFKVGLNIGPHNQRGFKKNQFSLLVELLYFSLTITLLNCNFHQYRTSHLSFPPKSLNFLSLSLSPDPPPLSLPFHQFFYSSFSLSSVVFRIFVNFLLLFLKLEASKLKMVNFRYYSQCS